MRNPIRHTVDRLASRVANEVERRHAEPSTREHYAAIAQLRARYGWSQLAACELRVFSQNGEDGVLAEILDRLGISDGFFVEFGADTGVETNSRLLADVLDWRGVYFEANPDAFAALAALYANSDTVATVNAFVTPETVNKQFADVSVPADFAVLSIDVDGQDYWIWEAIDGFTPSVVTIEFNSSLDATAQLVEPRGARSELGVTGYGGASLGALVALGKRKGYELVHVELAGVNAFFVRAQYASLFGTPRAAGPNYWLQGRGHPPGDGPYVDVSVERSLPTDA